MDCRSCGAAFEPAAWQVSQRNPYCRSCRADMAKERRASFRALEALALRQDNQRAQSDPKFRAALYAKSGGVPRPGSGTVDAADFLTAYRAKRVLKSARKPADNTP